MVAAVGRRHLPRGWDSEAVGADIVEIAELLNLSVSAAEQLIRDVWPELDDD